MALTFWHGVGRGVVALRPVEEDIGHSSPSTPIFHARTTATAATDRVSPVSDVMPVSCFAHWIYDSLVGLEGEWHELETKREKARKRKKEAAG